MKTIDFDIEKAKSGDYEIITENGLPVRIVCWDKQDGVFKIVGLVKNRDGYEFCQSYDENGSAREDDTAFDLRLVCPDPDPMSELTDFEYKVGSSMYGSYIDEINEEGLACVRATARELLDLAKMELFNEAWFDSHNEKETDVLESNVSEVLHDVIETALWKHWRGSKLSGVYGIRYTTQGSVIYDCVGGKEVDKNIVLDLVVDALNYKKEKLTAQPTFDGICIDTSNPDNKRYVEEHRVKSVDECDEQVLSRHITKDNISWLAAKVLRECGWCVMEQDEVTDLYDLFKSITERIKKVSNEEL